MFNETLRIELETYIDEHLDRLFELSEAADLFTEELEASELDSYIDIHRKPPFSEMLFHYIDELGYTDSEVYKKATIDRRHFSKIRSNPDYRISKPKAIALAIALELDKDDTEKLLDAAGYALSNHDTFDLVIQFFIEKKLYDIDLINQALDAYQLKPL